MDRRGAPRVGTGDAVDREMEVSFSIPDCYLTLSTNIISSNS
jgi:hypothetical protein